MKRHTILIALMYNFLFVPLFAQQYENFYTTKANLDTYYDSLIQANGIDSMQGTGYKQYKRWVDYWEPKLYPHGNFSNYRQGLEQYVTDFVSGNAPSTRAHLQCVL